MKVKNLGKMYAKIAAMPAAVKEEIRKALAQSAEEIVDLQKRFVPVDHGDLRESITWQYGDAKRIKHSQTIGAGLSAWCATMRCSRAASTSAAT